jgi:hypothetical protein
MRYIFYKKAITNQYVICYLRIIGVRKSTKILCIQYSRNGLIFRNHTSPCVDDRWNMVKYIHNNNKQSKIWLTYDILAHHSGVSVSFSRCLRVRTVLALSSAFHEQAQSNRACNISILLFCAFLRDFFYPFRKFHQAACVLDESRA